MTEQQRKTKIIDEDGLPVVDGDPRAQRFADDATTGMPGYPGMPGMPGAIPGLPPIPEQLLNRKGKLSLFKLIGWKGVAFLVLIVAALIGLAAVSFVVAAIALPILLLMGVIGWVVAKVRGPKPSDGSGRAVVIVRR